MKLTIKNPSFFIVLGFILVTVLVLYIEFLGWLVDKLSKG